MSRHRPYTEIGIRRVPCCRCGEPSRFQWTACAASGEFFPLCGNCDYIANDFLLRFLKVPDADARLERYSESIK